MKIIFKTLIALIFAIFIFYTSTTQSLALINGSVEPASVTEVTPSVTLNFTVPEAFHEYYFCIKNGGDCFFESDYTISVYSNADRQISITVCGWGDDKVKNCENGDYFHQTTYQLLLYGDDSATDLIGEVSFDVESPCPSGYEYSRDENLCGRQVSDTSECTSDENPVSVGGLLHVCTINPFSDSDDAIITGIVQPIPLPESPTRDKFSETGFLGEIISEILPIVLGIAGFITVILIIFSGIQMIFSSGNPEGAGAAQGRLTMTIVGFAIIILAFALTQIVDKIFLGGTGIF